MNNLPYRFIIIFAVILASCYILYPTYKFYSINSKQFEDLYSVSEQNDLKRKALSLGLDLTGGISLTLESDIPALLKSIYFKSNKTDIYPEKLESIIEKSNNISNKNNFFEVFEDEIKKENIELRKFYGNYINVKRNSDISNSDILEILRDEKNRALDNAINILTARINNTGLGDPNIQRSGKNRIIIELAGVTDLERILKLIKKTGAMELRLLRKAEKTRKIVADIDNYLALEKDTVLSHYNIFSSYPEYTDLGIIAVDSLRINHIKELLSNKNIQKIISKKNEYSGEFIWGNKFEIASNDEYSMKYKMLYYVKSKDGTEISGGDLKKSQANTAPPEMRHTGKYVIDMELTDEGAKKWRRTTGNNIGSQVAIILEKEVYMTPYIKDRIPNGKTQISGLSTFREAEDIVNVLSAGEMKPIKVGQYSHIGPSLGNDSMKAGKKSIIIGFTLVILFMSIYYKLAGLVASIAMFMNLIIIIAVLAMFGWVDDDLMVTLTLPGIAGLILTIGMAVDANVIVFERIKEELKVNKTIQSAIQSAYKRALVTILDANLTTLIAAIVLAGVGSGPIKGFAITLGIGILCSMFTAIFVTKTIFLSFPHFDFIGLKSDNKGSL